MTRLVNNTFDCGNTSTSKDKNPLRRPVTADSPHLIYWPSARRELDKLKFRKTNKKGVKSNGDFPSRKNWILCIKTFEDISKLFIHKRGAKEVNTRYMNQDFLECENGAIRSLCGSNDSPTARQFPHIYASHVLTDFQTRYSSHQNCESPVVESFVFSLMKNFKSLLNGGNNDDVWGAPDPNVMINCRIKVCEGSVRRGVNEVEVAMRLKLKKKLCDCKDCLNLINGTVFSNIVQEIINLCLKLLPFMIHWRGISVHTCEKILSSTSNEDLLSLKGKTCKEKHTKLVDLVCSIVVKKNNSCIL